MNTNIFKKLLDRYLDRSLPRAGQLRLFLTQYSDQQDNNGRQCRILAVIDKPDEQHDWESLPMYRVQFEDGTEIEALPEEITELLEDS